MSFFKDRTRWFDFAELGDFGGIANLNFQTTVCTVHFGQIFFNNF